MVRREVRDSVRVEKVNNMKYVFRFLAVISFVCIVGSAGAVEVDNISLLAGLVQSVFFIVCMFLFGFLAVVFDEDYHEQQK